MGKSVFPERWLTIIALTGLLVFLSGSGAFGQDRVVGEAGLHNQKGLEYFKKGFYDHAPKNQRAETERNYGLAVMEFKAAISIDSSNVEARRNLARVYYLQQNFDGAAEEYKRVTELAPGDLDAHVNLALSLIELKRLDEAIQVLENAKRQTSDPKTLNTLDIYLSKVRAYQAKELR